jgi:hypothetical protein
MIPFPQVVDYLGRENPYTHVPQRGNWDCVLASVAMWTKKTYEEVMGVFEKLGYSYRHLDSQQGCSSVESYKLLKKVGVEPFVIDEAFGSVPGMLSLPSLNRRGGAHAVFYDGRNIYDPQYGKPDKDYYDLQLPFWPSAFKMTIDLNDEYSYEMAEMWISMKKSQFDRAPRSKKKSEDQ